MRIFFLPVLPSLPPTFPQPMQNTNQPDVIVKFFRHFNEEGDCIYVEESHYCVCCVSCCFPCLPCALTNASPFCHLHPELKRNSCRLYFKCLLHLIKRRLLLKASKIVVLLDKDKAVNIVDSKSWIRFSRGFSPNWNFRCFANALFAYWENLTRISFACSSIKIHYKKCGLLMTTPRNAWKKKTSWSGERVRKPI